MIVGNTVAMKSRLMSKMGIFPKSLYLFSIIAHKSIPQIHPSEYIESQAWATQVESFPRGRKPLLP